ncbi:hypothetical protein ASA1KI_21570 [Opitutales bacterium ASA1]|uniref:hypothetical protein n=1 Tax=Congregicoccus parvus TaxID=3081749 RepID=UPI002B29156E|nr:hypothetical protein ASA1KI_21570 [Opitutales bacterium ASA1]
MKTIPSADSAKEVLLFDYLSIPDAPVDSLSEASVSFLDDQVRPICREQYDGSREDYAATHPLFGCVAGFVSAKLRITGKQAHFADVVVGCFDEYAIVETVNDVFSRTTSVSVTFHPGGSPFDFLTFRAMVHGTQLNYHPGVMLGRHLNIADAVSPRIGRGTPPLSVVVERLGLGHARKAMDLQALMSAARADDRVEVANELLQRVSEIGSVYARLFLTPEIEVISMGFDGSILRLIGEE